jgi:hypothetical protein
MEGCSSSDLAGQVECWSIGVLEYWKKSKPAEIEVGQHFEKIQG